MKKIIEFVGNNDAGKTTISNFLYFRNINLIRIIKFDYVSHKEWFHIPTKDLTVKLLNDLKTKILLHQNFSGIIILEKGFKELTRRMVATAKVKKDILPNEIKNIIANFKSDNLKFVEFIDIEITKKHKYTKEIFHSKCCNLFNLYNLELKKIRVKCKYNIKNSFVLDAINDIENIIFNIYKEEIQIICKELKNNISFLRQNTLTCNFYKIYRVFPDPSKIINSLPKTLQCEIDKIKTLIPFDVSKYTILVSGSYFYKENHDDSDLDLIILFHEKNDYEKAFEIDFSIFKNVGINIIFSDWIKYEGSKNYKILYDYGFLPYRFHFENLRIIIDKILLMKSLTTKGREIDKNYFISVLKSFFDVFGISIINKNNVLLCFLELISEEDANCSEYDLKKLLFYLENEVIKWLKL